MGILEHFAPVFTFLFVFVLVYGVLIKTNPFGDNKGIYAMIAIVLAVITLFFPPVVKMVNIMAPWFVLIMVFVFLLILVIMAFGVSAGKIEEAFRSYNLILWIIIALAIGIAIFAFSQVYGASIASQEVNETGQFNETVKDIIFHPKVLGAVFILIFAAIAVRLLTSDEPK